MGRAGGGSRGGGGSFSRGGMGGGSFSRSGLGGSSFSRNSGAGRSGGSSFGGFGGHHHRPRPIHIHPGFGRRTVIINNSGNKTYTGTNTAGPNTYTGTTNTTENTANTTQQAYTVTPEQKLARAERMAKEAADNKKGAVKFFFVSLILLILGLVVAFGTKSEGFKKYDLSGTVDVGYTYDDGFTEGSGMTEAACYDFYQSTGIPLFFYTVKEYEKAVSTCDSYTTALYDSLFKDENHVLLAYYDNVNWWSWEIGNNVDKIMTEDDVNDLLDQVDSYWEDYSLSNDAVLAKGIAKYQDIRTSDEGGVSGLGTGLMIAGLVMLVIAIYQFINYGSDVKKYEEEAKKLEREIILSKPLETFGNQEVDDLKSKYDNM